MATTAFDLRAPAVRALREKIALGCRILAKLELVDYLGHVSARVPESEFVLIRARGAEQGNQLHMTYKQVTLVDMEARQVQGKFPPPDETKLHTEIYKARPDVAAIVHTHQGLTTVFGDLEKPILPMQGVTASVLAQCGHNIPIYRSSRKVTTTLQGVEVAQTLGDKNIVHLQNHGVTIVGQTVEEVVIYAIWLEQQAKLTWWASQIGEPRGMRADELALQGSEAFGMGPRWKYYASLLD
jgi:ribulose-5-phosphate 4-epimerase/fuculose-1-phosphate aldolase